MPPAGKAPLTPSSTPAGEAPPLPPEIEARRQAALSGWKLAAQQLMDACVARPEQNRQPVALEVGFVPAPRIPGEGQQVLLPDWVMVPSHELERLWQDTDPEDLQECLDRVRSLTLAVPLPDGALAHDFSASAESVLIQL